MRGIVHWQTKWAKRGASPLSQALNSFRARLPSIKAGPELHWRCPLATAQGSLLHRGTARSCFVAFALARPKALTETGQPWGCWCTAGQVLPEMLVLPYLASVRRGKQWKTSTGNSTALPFPLWDRGVATERFETAQMEYAAKKTKQASHEPESFFSTQRNMCHVIYS